MTANVHTPRLTTPTVLSRWAEVIEGAGLAMAVLNADFTVRHVNRLYAAAHGKAADFFRGHPLVEIVRQPELQAIFLAVRDSGIALAHSPERLCASRRTPALDDCHWTLTPFKGDDDQATSEETPCLVLTIEGFEPPAAENCGDGDLLSRLGERALAIITRKRAESAVRAGVQRYRALLDTMPCGFALLDVLPAHGDRAFDYRVVEVNPAFEAITGQHRAELIGRSLHQTLPELEARWLEHFDTTVRHGDCSQFDDCNQALGRHYRVTTYCPEAGQLAVLCDDITTLRRSPGFCPATPNLFR